MSAFTGVLLAVHAVVAGLVGVVWLFDKLYANFYDELRRSRWRLVVTIDDGAARHLYWGDK